MGTPCVFKPDSTREQLDQAMPEKKAQGLCEAGDPITCSRGFSRSLSQTLDHLSINLIRDFDFHSTEIHYHQMS
jgi:hypothetical protein